MANDRSDAVSSTIIHPSGSVVASCSGQRHFEIDRYGSSNSSEGSDDNSDKVSRSTYDNSLKLCATSELFAFGRDLLQQGLSDGNVPVPTNLP